MTNDVFLSNAFGRVVNLALDVEDRATNVVDANGVSLGRVFDNLGRVTGRAYPDTGVESFVYSAGGLVFYTNQLNQVTSFGYDAARRKISETNADLQVARFAYDPAGDLTNLVDALGHQASWAYSQYGWRTNKLDNNGSPTIIYTYDADGRPTNRWTVGTNNTGYAYDAAGNLLGITYSNAQPLTLTYAYDILNRLTNMVDQTGTNSCTYTPSGQLLTETEAAWASDTVSNSYSQGRRTGLALSTPLSTLNFSCAYDAAWRLTNLTSTAGTFTYAYDATGHELIDQISLPNSAYIASTYDSVARAKSTALANQWGQVLDGYSYVYDLAGRRTGITRNFGLGYNNVSVGYDNIGQVTSWTAGEPGGAARLNEQLAYAYDAAGNLNYRTNGGLVETFTVGVSNQIQNISRSGTLTVSGGTPAPATNLMVNGANALMYSDFTFASTNNTLTNGSNTFTVIAQDIHGTSATNVVEVNLPTPANFKYDGNGNLTNDGTRSFVYDVENQLTNVFVPSAWRVDFIYDGLGRRRVTREYSWGGSAWSRTNEIRYLYDGNLVIQERDSNNTVQVTYTRGLDLSGSIQGAGGIGGLLARTDSNGSTFYHADGSGNVTALMDGGGNIAARAEYDAFGRFIKLSGPMAAANRLWFSSKELEPLAGDYYFGRRFYEPVFGRWLNRDPLGETGGLNLYRSMANSPPTVADPYGLDNFYAGSSPGFAPAYGVQNAPVNLTLTLQPVMVAEYHPSIPVLSAPHSGPLLIPPAYTELVSTGGVRLDTQYGGDEALGRLAMDIADQAAPQAALILATDGLGELAGLAKLGDCFDAGSGESSFLQNYLNGSGGRWGGSETRALNDAIATYFKDQGYDIINGAGRGSDEWIPGPNGGTTGGTWVDITARAGDGSITRIQTINTLADGVMPTASEAAAAARIQAAFPNDTLILMAKPK